MSQRVVAGDVLAGKYRVERVLGSGGMGVVVAAWHLQLDVLVALKFMADEALTDAELAVRFLREARAAARLRSEHVARVMDFGTLDWGAPYLVMEYLEGSDLDDLMRGGPQPIPNAVEFVAQACDALEEAHRLGIVHRDVKPSNLFLTTRPNGQICIKVLDFGISKSSRASSKLYATRPSAFLGSPFYMAPEQMRAARDVDSRADIWALGATLYELLTGRVPFQAESLLDLALLVASADPVPPRMIRPQIPWALEQIVLRCLQKDPDDRFTSARALANALAPFMQQGKGPSHRVTSQRPRFEEVSTGAEDDDVTRVAPANIAREATEKAVAQPLGAVAPPALGLPNATKTLPLGATLQSAVPPLAQNAPRGWRTGARLSWGRSYRLLGKNPQTTLRALGVGLVASVAAVAFLVLRSGLFHRSPDVTPTAVMVSPPLPVATSGVAEPPKGMKVPVATEAPGSSARASTVSVTNLPNPPSPGPTPFRHRSGVPPVPSSAWSATPTRLDSGPSASASSPPTPSPMDDFDKNPYVR